MLFKYQLKDKGLYLKATALLAKKRKQSCFKALMEKEIQKIRVKPTAIMAKIKLLKKKSQAKNPMFYCKNYSSTEIQINLRAKNLWRSSMKFLLDQSNKPIKPLRQISAI